MEERRRKALEAARKNPRFGRGIIGLGRERAEEAWRKSAAARREIIARDRRRIALGLEPLSRLVKACPITQAEANHRCRMRKKGHIVRRGDPAVYWDEGTRREERLEARAAELGLLVTRGRR